MANTAGQWHALIDCYSQHRRPVARSNRLLWPTPQAVNVKGGAWDESGVFIYTTLNHIKFVLPSGDSGIVRTLDEVVYVAAVVKGVIHCIDRQLVTCRVKIDTTEYRFKLASVTVALNWPLWPAPQGEWHALN